MIHDASDGNAEIMRGKLHRDFERAIATRVSNAVYPTRGEALGGDFSRSTCAGVLKAYLQSSKEGL